MARTALITGITGQDGSWLAELLLEEGTEVHGLVRRVSTHSTGRIDHLADRLTLHQGDITDTGRLTEVLRQIQPDEVYHLAAQSDVGHSFEVPVHTAEVNAIGTARVLDTVRRHMPGAHVYNAATSEIFGNATGLQDASTPLRPRNPYAAAKAHAHVLCGVYREAWGLHVSSGILFNHESERRGERFVTRKITRAVGRIVHGLQDHVVLGNLDARRDWGHAHDYVRAMVAMVRQQVPGDFVIASGTSHSVRDFCERAFAHAGLDWSAHVRTDPAFERPADVDVLCGDASRARQVLGWTPAIDFDTLVRRMVEHDIALAATERSSL